MWFSELQQGLFWPNTSVVKFTGVTWFLYMREQRIVTVCQPWYRYRCRSMSDNWAWAVVLRKVLAEVNGLHGWFWAQSDMLLFVPFVSHILTIYSPALEMCIHHVWPSHAYSCSHITTSISKRVLIKHAGLMASSQRLNHIQYRILLTNIRKDGFFAGLRQLRKWKLIPFWLIIP